MNVLERLLNEESPYSLSKNEKQQLLNKEIANLTSFHKENCQLYANIIKSFNSDGDTPVPLPVRLFKLHKLQSISEQDTFKVLTSSGTTSQVVSQIILDKETAGLQTKVLIKIMQSYLGKQRLPMLIIDHPNVIKNRKSFSARGAGILGLSNFGRDHTYALTENMELDLDVVNSFLERHKGKPKFVFGFTFMVWKYFIQELVNNNVKLDFSETTLIHSGGWKKLIDEAVDNQTFKNITREYAGIRNIHNFYGMVEQVGSIFVECEHGYLHSPNFANVKIIDPVNFTEKGVKEAGVIQVESIIPRSYPGHILLTEDTGTVFGEDDCMCGRKGKYFLVHGRLPKAEVRGCSDTHEKT